LRTFNQARLTWRQEIAWWLFSFCSLILIVSSPAFADHKEIRIAALIPLSGPVSNAGVEIQRGMQLGVKSYANKEIKPVLIFEDTQYDLKQSATAAKKVIAQDNVDVIISLWDQADIVAPITEKAGVIHIAIRWDPAVTKNRPLTFTFEATYQTWIKDFVSLLKAQQIHNLSVVAEESASGTQAVEELRKQFQENQLTVLRVDMFPSATTDFRTILTKSLAEKPDSLFLYAFPPRSELLIKQLKQLAPRQRFTGVLEFIEDLSLVEGLSTVSPFVSKPEFNDLFRGRFGENSKIRAPHGYEIARILQELYQELWTDKKPTAHQVAKRLSEMKDRPSVLGPLTTGPERNIEHPTKRRTIKNGKWEEGAL